MPSYVFMISLNYNGNIDNRNFSELQNMDLKCQDKQHFYSIVYIKLFNRKIEMTDEYSRIQCLLDKILIRIY
jgi:hypothetical protein